MNPEKGIHEGKPVVEQEVIENGFLCVLNSTQHLQQLHAANALEAKRIVNGWKHSLHLQGLYTDYAAIMSDLIKGTTFNAAFSLIKSFDQAQYFFGRGGAIDKDLGAGAKSVTQTYLRGNGVKPNIIEKIRAIDEELKTHHDACFDDIKPLREDNREISHQISQSYNVFFSDDPHLEEMLRFLTAPEYSVDREKNRTALKIIADMEILHASVKKPPLDEWKQRVRLEEHSNPSVGMFKEFLESYDMRTGRGIAEWMQFFKRVLRVDQLSTEMVASFIEAEPFPQELVIEYGKFVSLTSTKLVTEIKSALLPFQSRLKRVPILKVPDLRDTRARKEKVLAVATIDETDTLTIEDQKPVYKVFIRGNESDEDGIDRFMQKAIGTRGRDNRFVADIRTLLAAVINDPYGNTYKLTDTRENIGGVKVSLRSFNPHDKKVPLLTPTAADYRIVYAVRSDEIHLYEILVHNEFDKRYVN